MLEEIKQCRLGEFIKENGIKKKWLAGKVEISRNSLNNIIDGIEPGLFVARRIAKAVNSTVEYLWPEDNPM